MKKLLMVFLCICLLFSGCTAQNSSDEGDSHNEHREKGEYNAVFYNAPGEEPVRKDITFSKEFIRLFKQQYLVLYPAEAYPKVNKTSLIHYDVFDENGREWDIYMTHENAIIFVNDMLYQWNPDNELNDFVYLDAYETYKDTCKNSEGPCTFGVYSDNAYAYNDVAMEYTQNIYTKESVFPILYIAYGKIKVRLLVDTLNGYIKQRNWDDPNSLPQGPDAINIDIDENTSLDEWFGTLSGDDYSILKTVQYQNMTIKIVLNYPGGLKRYFIHVDD